MVVPVLCMVCFFLLVWVMLLKAEVSRLTLKYESRKTNAGLASKADCAYGNKSYKID